MRQRLLINGLITVLFLSGWSGVLASAMCRHAGLDLSTNARLADAEALPACCRTDKEDATHCPMSKGHVEASEHHSSSATRGADGAQTPQGLDAQPAFAVAGAHAAVHSRTDCAHCVTRSEHSRAPVGVPEPDSGRRERAAHASQVQRLDALAASYVPSVIPSRRAPPGGPATRHILYSVFLI